jgi:hypothetical protein
MLGADTPEPNQTARNIWRYGSIVLALVAIYVGWIVYSRWQENGALEKQAAEQKAAKEHEQAERTVEELGGNKFEIISFYAMPGIIRRGDSSQLCYGVSNAKSVRLDPPGGTVWPSLNRCFAITPRKDTTYTLTAEDANGNSKNASFTLKVQ